MMNYFVTQLPPKWNMLEWNIHLALDEAVLHLGDVRAQFVATRQAFNGMWEGFYLNLN